MNFIARDTDYAIRALVFMAASSGKDVVTVDEIVKEDRLPERFLRRILQRLAKKNVLRSHKGKRGGFSFLKSPGKIRLADLIEIFQGKLDFTNCLLKGRICPNVNKCLLRKKLKGICFLVKKELEKITIASLSKGE
ncbi:MAG: Rrf2 family transcriptional regulator [Candidatus Omnitrophica bacterium]|nr:Rrf2 family transcriptional regulator [Candidatus Omnitrophota bacterium]